MPVVEDEPRYDAAVAQAVLVEALRTCADPRAGGVRLECARSLL